MKELIQLASEFRDEVRIFNMEIRIIPYKIHRENSGKRKNNYSKIVDNYVNN